MRAVEKTYKPDSVPTRICSQSAEIISLGFGLPRTSSDLPEDLSRASWSPALRKEPMVSSYLALHRTTLTLPVMSPPPRWALTPPFHPYLCHNDERSHRVGHRRSVLCGAGVGLLRLGVTQRPAREVRTFLSSRSAMSDPPVFPLAQSQYRKRR